MMPWGTIRCKTETAPHAGAEWHIRASEVAVAVHRAGHVISADLISFSIAAVYTSTETVSKCVKADDVLATCREPRRDVDQLVAC